MFPRRSVLAGAGAVAAGAATGVLSAPTTVQAESQRVLKFMPQAALVVLDPGNFPGYVTRNHAAMIFDQLYGMDSTYQPQPQMVEGHTIDNDGKRWTMKLRDGLMWHDGEKVLARDCVASVKRWGKRDPLGVTVMALTDELSAPDDKTIVFQLKQPFPMLATALSKVPTFCCFMMPERIANTDPSKPNSEMIGSGPYKFVQSEFNPAARSVYERFAQYKPRESGTPDWTAGPKITYFDRVEWNVILDPATASAAMQRGEQDWWERASLDLLPLMKKDKNMKVDFIDPSGGPQFARVNFLQPPFNNPVIRRAFMLAISQEECMQAISSDPSMYKVPLGIFTPGTPMANDEGMEIITSKRDIAAAKKMILDAGYKNEVVRLLAPTDYPELNALGDVLNDVLKRLGMNVDYVVTDWATMLTRRGNPGPVAQGGWSVFVTGQGGTDWMNPMFDIYLRATGQNAGTLPGWPNIPEIEKLRMDWLNTQDLKQQQAICRNIQKVALQEMPIYPLGSTFSPSVYRNNLTHVNRGYATFWNVRRA